MNSSIIAKRQTVIYVLGAGNSGSTIISMALGAHSKAVSVGELWQIDKYQALNRECSCNQLFRSCRFWSEVVGSKERADLFPVMPSCSTWKVLFRPDTVLAADPNYLQIIDHNVELYNRITLVSGKDVIIDSSKNLVRFFYLLKSGRVNLIPLYVTRDGRAYIDSMKRRGRISALRAMFRWIKLNFEVTYLIRRLGISGSINRVNYEAFTQDVESVLTEICSKAGLKYEEGMQDYWKQDFHNVAGTRSRFELKPISPHFGWNGRLSAMSKFVFSFFGGKFFNRFFGVKQ